MAHVAAGHGAGSIVMADDVRHEVPPPPLLSGEESLEELRSVLWRAHGVSVDRHDPVLMVHTIHRVALHDIERMLDGQARRFSDAGEALAGKLATDVTAAIEDLKSEALTDALRERLAIGEDLRKATSSAHAALRRSLRLMTILTAMNYLAVLITGAFLVFVIGF